MEHGFGAYGLTVPGPPVGAEWWNEAPDGWLPWRTEWQPSGAESWPEGPGVDGRRVQFVGPDRAFLSMKPFGFLECDRLAGTTTFFVSECPGEHGLIHPYFGPSAVVHAWWQGWEAFHAGGVVVGDRVWALLGDREFGKSSALAWFHANGWAVFADDLIVVAGGSVLAGPRCLDLREGAARRFGAGEDVGVIGARRRWRVRLPPVPPELPLAGWVVLSWSGGEPRVRKAAADERLRALTRSRALLVPRDDSLAWLDLASAPMFVVERPRDWSVMDRAMSELAATLHRAAC